MGSNHVKFYLFEGPKPYGVLPIYMRITYARKKAELHTGFPAPKRNGIWLTKTQGQVQLSIKN